MASLTIIDINKDGLIEILEEGSNQIKKISEAFSIYDNSFVEENMRIAGQLEGAANIIKILTKNAT